MHGSAAADGGDGRPQAVTVDHATEPVRVRPTTFLEENVGVRDQDLRQDHPRRRHRQGIAVEGPLPLHRAVREHPHRLLGPTDRPDGHAPADRLGERDHVGSDAEPLARPARRDGRPGLHLVEREQSAVPVQEFDEALEVARFGLDHADVHRNRLEDHPRYPVAFLVQDALHRSEVVERHHPKRPTVELGHAGRVRDRDRPVGGTRLVHVDPVREGEPVRAPVVTPLDLDHEVAPGRGAHDPACVHRRLRTRVLEPPQREPEAFGEQFGDHDRVLDRHREVRPERDARPDRLDDLGMGVTDHHDAVAGVQVDVRVAVEVPHPGALAPIAIDRERVQRVPRTGHAAGQALARPLGERDRARQALGDPCAFAFGELGHAGRVDVGHAASCSGTRRIGRSARRCPTW
jgi:hypothetical protein